MSEKKDIKVVDFKSVRKTREREIYNELVIKTFQDMEHADKRAFLEKRADVERAGRERL